MNNKVDLALEALASEVEPGTGTAGAGLDLEAEFVSGGVELGYAAQAAALEVAPECYKAQFYYAASVCEYVSLAIICLWLCVIFC